MSATRRPSSTGLRQFLDPRQQDDWMRGKTILRDADERSESLELRFKYVARFEKPLRRPQAPKVLENRRHQNSGGSEGIGSSSAVLPQPVAGRSSQPAY